MEEVLGEAEVVECEDVAEEEWAGDFRLVQEAGASVQTVVILHLKGGYPVLPANLSKMRNPNDKKNLMYSFHKVQILGFLDNTLSFRRFHVASARYFYLVLVKESHL